MPRVYFDLKEAAEKATTPGIEDWPERGQEFLTLRFL